MTVNIIQYLLPFDAVQVIDFDLDLASLGLALLYATVHALVTITLECRLTLPAPEP